jgi:hypothetical protein
MATLDKKDNEIMTFKYQCSYCKLKLNLKVDKELHLYRTKNNANGLAEYIDIHENTDTNLGLHGVKLQVDFNFHVRGNDLIEKKDESNMSSILKKNHNNLLSVPIPKYKKRVETLNTNYIWSSWLYLEITSRNHNLKFTLNNFDSMEDFMNDEDIGIDEVLYQLESPLGLIKCKFVPKRNVLYSSANELLLDWVNAMLQTMETASDLNVDLIPEIFRLIDSIIHSEYLFDADKNLLVLLSNKSSLIIPYKYGLTSLLEHGESIEYDVINYDFLVEFTERLVEHQYILMKDIQAYFSTDLVYDTELVEEYVIFALAYAYFFDIYEYKLPVILNLNL